ncbi:hypothetical protein BHE74_00027908 [Ensete ventricosum]|nr:hypothetical protein BHE74_00027908 [Ensete ventricosum]
MKRARGSGGRFLNTKQQQQDAPPSAIMACQDTPASKSCSAGGPTGLSATLTTSDTMMASSKHCPHATVSVQGGYRKMQNGSEHRVPPMSAPLRTVGTRAESTCCIPGSSPLDIPTIASRCVKMPELRSGVRRGSHAPSPPTEAVDRPLRNTRARAAAKKPPPAEVAIVVGRRGRTRAAPSRPVAKGRQRVRLAKERRDLVEEAEGKGSDQLKEVIVVVEEEETKGKEPVNLAEEIRGKEIMGDDTGGLSANKVAVQEEEGNTTPFPKKNKDSYASPGFSMHILGKLLMIQGTPFHLDRQVSAVAEADLIVLLFIISFLLYIHVAIATRWKDASIGHHVEYDQRPDVFRYHYNVADARLAQHIDRGNEDGLLISCVASSSNLWALIMDAGTGFTSQIYELSPFFLHKSVISVDVCEPERKHLSRIDFKGFHVTSMATAGSRWGIVMSRNAGFSDQVVELDFLYPSEGIHRRWDNGYRITCMGATWDQAALILSVPKRKPGDETQETLRTSAFPSAHVKVCILI